MSRAQTREPTGTPAVVRLRLVLPVRVELERVPAMFGGDAADWLGERAPDAPGIRRFYCDLELRVGPEGWATFHKSTIVGLGKPERDEKCWVIPIEWRAATLAPLFPVFAGHLRFGIDRIELDGHYAPPGGTVGYILDRALLHLAAQGTGRWFLQKVVDALGTR